MTRRDEFGLGLAREAARATGLSDSVPQALEDRWTELTPWSGVEDALDALRGRARLAVVTNCSKRLGELAAARLSAHWDCVVTAEEAGFYKPHPQPYQLALERLGVGAADAAFVAGSGYDLIGTSAVGLRTYWHNRAGLKRPEHAPPSDFQSPDLAALMPWSKDESDDLHSKDFAMDRGSLGVIAMKQGEETYRLFRFYIHLLIDNDRQREGERGTLAGL